MRNQFTPNIEDLPNVIPLFPLKGAVVLPNGQLPLNIFEPRYIDMVFDALSGDRLIGMIQPLEKNFEALHSIGCAGRIISFSETRDNRILLLLSGISRFELVREVDLDRSYRRAEVSWNRFVTDLIDDDIQYDRDQLMSLAKIYLEQQRLSIEWTSLDNLTFAELVDTLGSSLPFSPRDKQGIIETLSVQKRCEMIVALCEFTAEHSADGEDRMH